MISYAQDREDLILYELLGDVKEGRYIDVGANDPEIISVTKLFYDLGWKGINIEPLDYKHKALEAARPRDINLCIALGEEHGKAVLYDLDTGSSFREDIVSKYHRDFPKVEKEIFTLSEVFDQYCKDWEDIHFCKVDVEGYEKNVLQGIKDWEKIRPWVFCMESTLPETTIPCYDEWEYILLENGYKLICEHGINRFYGDAVNHPELLEAK